MKFVRYGAYCDGAGSLPLNENGRSPGSGRFITVRTGLSLRHLANHNDLDIRS